MKGRDRADRICVGFFRYLMLDQDVRVHVLCLDVVQGAVDAGALTDYMKQNLKKEVVFLNGGDFADAAGRASKIDQKKDKSQKIDTSPAIARVLKQKLDSEVVRLTDAKKKALAAYEKQKAAFLSGKSKIKNFQELTKYDFAFEGCIDALYILQNFPYLPNQFEPLTEIDYPLSFLCIVPQGGATPTPYTKKVTMEKSGKQPAKKVTIPGCEMDSLTNPEAYPPARWVALRPTAPASIPFIEMEAGDNVEATWKKIERQIITLHFAKDEYVEKFSDKTFLTLPSCVPIVDRLPVAEYLTDRNGDFVNALTYALKLNDWTPKVPDPPLPIEEEYNALFAASKESLNRTVVFVKPKELPEPDFDLNQIVGLSPLLHALTHWSVTPENAYSCIALAQFLQAPVNFYAYAGQKFDQIFMAVNKKYQLGMPLAFFDWTKWDLSTEYQAVGEPLMEAVNNSEIVETFLDQQIGIMWIMCLPPIPRTMGHFMAHYSVPQTMEGFSDFIKYLYDKEGETEKKTRNPPSPAHIIREKGNFALLMPPLAEKVNQASQIFGMPLEVSNCAEFTAPYYFTSRLKVVINRNIISGSPTFEYKAYFKDLVEVSSPGKTVMFIPVEGIRIMIEYPFAVTLLFNEQSLRYDAENVVVKSTGEDAIVITKDRALIKNEADTLMMVLPDGTIGKQIDGQWSYVTSDCTCYEKNAEGVLETVEKRHSKIEDIASKTTSIIRPDNVEYYIKDDGTRKILVGNELSVEQSQEKTIFDIPNFPVFEAGETISISLDRFEITFKDKTAKISCEDYTISVTEGSTLFTSPDVEMCLTPGRCEFKSGDQVLIADEEGIEKMTQVGVEIPAKKKIEVFETHWGKSIPIKETLTEAQQLELHKLFCPRFFAVRGDLSGCEFIRSDTIDMTDITVKELVVPHPSGNDCTLKSYHHPTKMPVMFLQNEVMTKPERATILKSLHVPKPKKRKGATEEVDEGIVVEAEGARESYMCDTKIFTSAMMSKLASQSAEYIEETTPPPPEPPEVIPVPPPTPDPRILEMQASLYQNTVAGLQENNVLNYWEATEGRFAMPLHEPRVLERPLSPRVQLFDPPREAKHLKIDAPVEPPAVKSPRTSPGRTIRAVPVTKTRPMTVKATPDIINFGTVKANTPATASLVITNTGKKPLHFAATQPGNKALKVLTIPGVVFPGLKMTLKVALEPTEAQYISTHFTVTMKEVKEEPFELKIPVVVTIAE